MKVLQQTKTKRMKEMYGKTCEAKSCEKCCNLRNMDKKNYVHSNGPSYCCAYGNDNVPWDVKAEPCGLYNTPFVMLQPARKAVKDIYADDTHADHDCMDGQMALFL